MKILLAILAFILALPVQGQILTPILFRHTSGTPQASTPTFSPAAGSYSSTQTVTISTATPLAVLCYTTDGSTPTETANLCSGGTTSTYSTPITVSTTQTVKAIATLATYTDSAYGTALYTISAGIAYIGTSACSTIASGTSIKTGSYTSTNGSTLLLGITTHSAAPTPSVADSGTYNSYAQDGSTATVTSPNYNALMFGTGAGANTRTGAMTFTVSSLLTANNSVCISEYSGVLHIGTSYTATGSGTTYTKTVTAPEANDWLVCSIANYGYGYTATSGTIRHQTIYNNGDAIQDYTSSSTTLTVSGTMGSSDNWAMSCTVLRRM
jgi:hypothetical protein